MPSIELEPAKFTGGKIVTQASHEAIAERVAAGNIVILRGVFEPEYVIRLRDAVHQWGLSTPATNPSDPKATWHRIDDEPPMSQTKRIFHAYVLIFDDNDRLVLDPANDQFGMGEVLAPVCKAMRDLQNSLTGTAGTWLPDSDGHCFRPQIIHYPSGGGYFDTHLHPILPQKIGLILNLSQIGTDFSTGSTRFETGGAELDTEGQQLQGDLCLFKYDLPHDISRVDEADTLDWTSKRGRWTLITPFF